MKITNVEAIPFRIPLRPEVGIMKSVVFTATGADHVLVRVETGQGIAGHAEAFERIGIYGESQASIVAVIKKYLGPAIIGMDVCDVEKINEAIERYGANWTAKAAIDIAVHDALGQILGLPIYKMIGGYREPKAPIIGTLSITPPEETARKGKEMLDTYGVKGFKAKVGVDPKRDVAAMIALRNAVGPEPLIYVDANQGYAPDEAIRTIQRMEEADLAWVEEPVRQDDLAGKARVAKSINVPILLDESVWEPKDVMRNIRMDIGGVFSIKSMRSGIHRSRQIAAMAEAANIPCLTGTGRDTVLGAVASAHLICGLKNVYMGEILDHKLYEGTITKETPRIEDGCLVLPEGPGLGLHIDENALQKYQVQA